MCSQSLAEQPPKRRGSGGRVKQTRTSGTFFGVLCRCCALYSPGLVPSFPTPQHCETCMYTLRTYLLALLLLASWRPPSGWSQPARARQLSPWQACCGLTYLVFEHFCKGSCYFQECTHPLLVAQPKQFPQRSVIFLGITLARLVRA